MNRLSALRGIRPLSSCSDRELAFLARQADEVRVQPGDVVAKQGESCSAFVIVMEGILHSECGLLGPGGSLGWEEMWERSPSPQTVVAESEARLLVMGHAQFRAVKSVSLPLARIETCSPRRFPSPLSSVSSSSIAAR